MQIDSLIAEFLIKTDQEDVVVEFELEPFTIAVLRAERTFVEKISAVTKGSYLSENGSYNLLKKNIRHFYDLSKLMDIVGNKVLNNKEEFLQLLNWVKTDDKKMDTRGVWAGKEYKKSLIYTDFDNVWLKLSDSYSGQFKDMLYGNEVLPTEKKVKETIQAIAKCLQENEPAE